MDLQLNKKSIILALGTLVIGFITGLLCYYCVSPKIEETTVVRVDTLVIEKPIPYKVEVVRKVSVPVYVPTPADTVVIAKVDSILVEVPVEVEKREFRDTTYRAVVSGPKIGELRPTLESLELYSRTTTTVINSKPPLFTPYVSACAGDNIFGIGGGISIREQFDLGAKYVRINKQNGWMLEASYKFKLKK
jgi:hypothetical protein